MNKIILCCAFLLLALSSCYTLKTKTFNTPSELSATSEPIHLVHPNMQTSSFDFILTRHFKDSAADYAINVRWKSFEPSGNFATKGNTLKFLINNLEIMSLEQKSKPRFVGMNLDSSQVEEECTFIITREQLEKLALAKRVKVELTGKSRIETAKFSRFTTFRAFKQFLNQI